MATWPFVDRLTMYALRRLFFPSSRLWAAAESADLDGDAFCDDLGLTLSARQRDKLSRALSRTADRRRAAGLADAAWQDAFFGDRPTDRAARLCLEAARRDARHRYYSARGQFRFLLGQDVPLVRRRPVSPADVEAVYGHAVDNPGDLFRPGDRLPPVEKSATVEVDGTRHYWLRFTSPYERLGDPVYVHVYEPIDMADPPTVILGHGICVEFDHWQGLLDEAQVLSRQGIRVLRPEAPYHGRRRPLGYYGGEWVIAESPLSSLDTFVGAVHERAAMISWCRAQGHHTVAIGGSSLGAMMAIVTAEQSHDWPAHLRPDGLIMITQCERPIEGLVGGAIARMFGSQENKRMDGWTDELLQRYLGILEPKRAPVMPAERIVSILGEYDTATPFKSGKALITRWRVPAENSFIWPCGHFTVPIRLARDPAPLRRFAGVLAQAA